MKKGSWLKEKLDPLVLNFVELGYVEDLKWRYMGKNRQCSNAVASTNKDDMQFDLRHTGGLFVFLLAAIGLAIILLVLEHITYFVILPRLKKKPPDSIWKKRNMEYFSQRLYKSINSEKVEPPAKVLLSKVKKRKFEIQSRIRQARKGSANLPSHELRNRRINRILDIAYKSFYEMKNVHSDSDIYTISGSVDEEIADILSETDITPPAGQMNSSYDISEDILSDTGYDNPVFDSDGADIVVENTNDSDRCETCSIKIEDTSCDCQVNTSNEQNRLPLGADRSHKVQGNSRTHNERDGQNSYSPMRKEKRYETWPSPQRRKRSVKRMQNNNVKSFSNADRENAFQSNRIVNEIPAKRCRSCSSTSLEGLTTGRKQTINLNLKDNRLKSNIRNHAMAVTERRRSMAFDQGAVEALSKEDLLILWKRSEIDLQTRLNRMQHQNSHLRRLVHIIEEYQRKSVRGRSKQDGGGRKRNISNEQLRQGDESARQQEDERTGHYVVERKRQKRTDDITRHLAKERKEKDDNAEPADEKTKVIENNLNKRKNPKDSERTGKSVDRYRRQRNEEQTMKSDDRTNSQGNETWQLYFEGDTDEEDDGTFIMTTRL